MVEFKRINPKQKNMAQWPELTKKAMEKIMSATGRVRGLAMKAELDYILKEKGIEGIRRIEQAFEDLGCPLKYKEIKIFDFYPIGYDALLNLIIKDLFNFQEEDFLKIGQSAPKSSNFFKIIAKYFFSLKKAVEQATYMWHKYYTIGDLKSIKLDEEKRITILRLSDFSFPYTKIACLIIRGYIMQVARMVTKTDASCQEIKCMFEGDPYHEFLIKW